MLGVQEWCVFLGMGFVKDMCTEKSIIGALNNFSEYYPPSTARLAFILDIMGIQTYGRLLMVLLGHYSWIHDEYCIYAGF